MTRNGGTSSEHSQEDPCERFAKSSLTWANADRRGRVSLSWKVGLSGRRPFRDSAVAARFPYSKTVAINQEKDLGGPGRYTRFRDTFRRNTLLNTTWRVGVFTVGATVLAAGLAMLVLPGPGFLGII